MTVQRLVVLLCMLALTIGTAPAAAAPAPDPYDVVHARHWGPIRFGDSVHQANQRGADVRFDPERQDFWEEHGCGYADVFHGDDQIGSVMVWDVNGRVIIKRVQFVRGFDRNVPTASGVEFGMTERALRRRADRRDWDITIRNNPYGSQGEHEIIHRVMRADGRTYAYKYLTQHRSDRTVVDQIYAGHRNAVRLIEGCV